MAIGVALRVAVEVAKGVDSEVDLTDLEGWHFKLLGWLGWPVGWLSHPSGHPSHSSTN